MFKETFINDRGYTTPRLINIQKHMSYHSGARLAVKLLYQPFAGYTTTKMRAMQPRRVYNHLLRRRLVSVNDHVFTFQLDLPTS